MGRKPLMAPLEQVIEGVKSGVVPEAYCYVKVRGQLYHAKGYKYHTLIRIELEAVDKLPEQKIEGG